MRFSIGKRPKERAEVGLTHETARAAMLAMLHGKALAVARLVNNPAPTDYDRELRELLELLILRLQVNAHSDHIVEAKAQIEGICKKAELSKKRFDEVIANLYERSDAEVNIKTISASPHESDVSSLRRVYCLSNEGGIFKRLAKEGMELAAALSISTEQFDECEGNVVVSTRAQVIQAERVRLSPLPSDEDSLQLSRSWEVKNQEAQSFQEIVKQYHAETSREGRTRVLLSTLRNPLHCPLEFLVGIVLTEGVEFEERELATCIVEQVAAKIPKYDANELGRKLLARLTAFSVGSRFSADELFLVLRMFATIGDIDGGPVIAQLLEDDLVRERFIGSKFESGILFLIVGLLERGGDAARSLAELVTGNVVTNLADQQLALLKAKATRALVTQRFGAEKLLEIFNDSTEQPQELRDAIVASLALDDSAEKVLALVAMGGKLLREEDDTGAMRLRAVVGALSGTRHPEGQRFLYGVVTSRRVDQEIKLQAAHSMQELRGALLLCLVDELIVAVGEARKVILTALLGNPDATRFGILVKELSRPVSQEGSKEDYHLWRLASIWGIV